MFRKKNTEKQHEENKKKAQLQEADQDKKTKVNDIDNEPQYDQGLNLSKINEKEILWLIYEEVRYQNLIFEKVMGGEKNENESNSEDSTEQSGGDVAETTENATGSKERKQNK